MNRKKLLQGIISLGFAALVVGVGIALAMLHSWMFGDEKTPSATQTSAVSSGAKVGDRDAVPVVVQAARTMVFEHRLDVSGNVLAKRFALVSARMRRSLRPQAKRCPLQKRLRRIAGRAGQRLAPPPGRTSCSGVAARILFVREVGVPSSLYNKSRFWRIQKSPGRWR